jgi:hypothetical protein
MVLVPTSTMPVRRLQDRQSPVVKSVGPENIVHLDAAIPEKAS